MSQGKVMVCSPLNSGYARNDFMSRSRTASEMSEKLSDRQLAPLNRDKVPAYGAQTMPALSPIPQIGCGYKLSENNSTMTSSSPQGASPMSRLSIHYTYRTPVNMPSNALSVGTIMFETEYDNLAIGRFMDPSVKSPKAKHSSSHHSGSKKLSDSQQPQHLPEVRKNRQTSSCTDSAHTINEGHSLESELYNKMLLDISGIKMAPQLPEDTFLEVPYTKQSNLNTESAPTVQSLPKSTNFSQNLTVNVDQSVIEPPCVKTDVNYLQDAPNSQESFAQSVLMEHSDQSFKQNQFQKSNASLMDDLEETLQLFLKEVRGEDPAKDLPQSFASEFQTSSSIGNQISNGGSSGAPSCNLYTTSQSPIGRDVAPLSSSYQQNQLPMANCSEFIAPQQRAPRSACRFNNRETQQQSPNGGSLLQIHQNCPSESNATCCSLNPSYTVTEWLNSGVPGCRSSPGQSLRSSLTISSLRRGKKRALSSSPLSTDGIDLNAVIRTSPTSLVAYINGSQTSSASLSPALGVSGDRAGCYGHLSARTSPFTSRSNSSQRRGSILSPITNYRNRYDEEFVTSVHSLENEPSVRPEEMHTLANQSIHTLESNLQMLDAPSYKSKKEAPSSCKCNKVPEIRQPMKAPPPSYSEHMAETMKRSQNKTLKPIKDDVENDDHDDYDDDRPPAVVAAELRCKWIDCRAVCDDQQQLVRHIERSHVEQRKGDEFTCFWHGCSRRTRPFNARYKLLIHMRVHSGEKPNKCNYEGCTKAFSRLENLKIHERSHTGEKPYICQHPDCMKRFSNSSDRAKHQRTHLDTKPYACQVPGCNKRYTDPSSLRKHVKNHFKDHHTTKKKLKGGKQEEHNDPGQDALNVAQTNNPGNQRNGYVGQADVKVTRSPGSVRSSSVRRTSPFVLSELMHLQDISNNSNPRSRSSYLPPITEKVHRYHIPALQDYDSYDQTATLSNSKHVVAAACLPPAAAAAAPAAPPSHDDVTNDQFQATLSDLPAFNELSRYSNHDNGGYKDLDQTIRHPPTFMPEENRHFQL